MENIPFYKYQGCGNDFIMIDNRTHFFDKFGCDVELIRRMCDRKFGVGADGLISITTHTKHDFEMVYYNADGMVGTMCGNGARCALAFAQLLGLYSNAASFLAIDGAHIGTCTPTEREYNKICQVKMADVNNIQVLDNRSCFMDTGSPHHVTKADNIEGVCVKVTGQEIRNSAEYRDIGGTNANFIQIADDGLIKIRTFERGVEDETMACGTGSVAAAIASEVLRPHGNPPSRTVRLYRDYNGDEVKEVKRKVQTLGGDLDISFTLQVDDNPLVPKTAWDIFLVGPAVLTFQGSYVM